MKYWLLIIALTFVLFESFGQKYSNEFLNLGVGARAMGMGNANSAASQDVYSGYWNPAGLTGLPNQYNVGLMHAEYFAGIAKYDYVGFAMPIDSLSSFGVSVIRFGADNIQNTLNLFRGQDGDFTNSPNYDNIKLFSVSDNALLLSYARKSAKIKGLSYGGNFKVIYRNLGDFANAWGFGLDVGALYQKSGWRLAAVGKDITATYNIWTVNQGSLKETFEQTGNTVPDNSTEITKPSFTLGASKLVRFGNEKMWGILPSLDLYATTDGKRNTLVSSKVVSMDPRFGLEADYKKVIYLRTGFNKVQKKTTIDREEKWSAAPNLGIGLRLYGITLDYALTSLTELTGSNSLYSNVFSLKFELK